MLNHTQPNVTPDYASAHFLARAVTRTQLAELKSKFDKCFEAAAVATGCQVKIKWQPQGPTEGS